MSPFPEIHKFWGTPHHEKFLQHLHSKNVIVINVTNHFVACSCELDCNYGFKHTVVSILPHIEWNNDAKWNKSSLKRSVPAKWLKDVWQSPAAAPTFPWWPPKVRQGKYLLSLQHVPLRKSEECSSGIPNTPKKLADLLAPQGKDLYFAILIRVKH